MVRELFNQSQYDVDVVVEIFFFFFFLGGGGGGLNLCKPV